MRNGKRKGNGVDEDLRKSLDSLEETTKRTSRELRQGTGDLRKIADRIAESVSDSVVPTP
jgi:hypothetical protein